MVRRAIRARREGRMSTALAPNAADHLPPVACRDASGQEAGGVFYDDWTAHRRWPIGWPVRLVYSPPSPVTDSQGDVRKSFWLRTVSAAHRAIPARAVRLEGGRRCETAHRGFQRVCSACGHSISSASTAQSAARPAATTSQPCPAANQRGRVFPRSPGGRTQ